MVKATVVITTKNRRDELRIALESAIRQSANPEVLVIDDGSTDGTEKMIRTDFPEVRLHRTERSLGYIVQRNRAAALAAGEIILSIDDDAAFSTPSVVEQTLAEFGSPRVGAVAIPYLNVNKENLLLQRAPASDAIYVTSEFVGTAHALRRDLFIALGGYREFLFHQGEERDYCIRMLNSGYLVRLGSSDPIHHFESPRRDFRRMDLYGRRNDVLFAWHNAPLSKLPSHLIGTTLLGMRFGLKVGRPLRMSIGLLRGWAAILHELRRRNPVRPGTYRAMWALRRERGLRVQEIENMLSPLILS
jgi:glycosyltransferase involved in cell wall biosynthesis